MKTRMKGMERKGTREKERENKRGWHKVNRKRENKREMMKETE